MSPVIHAAACQEAMTGPALRASVKIRVRSSRVKDRHLLRAMILGLRLGNVTSSVGFSNERFFDANMNNVLRSTSW